MALNAKPAGASTLDVAPVRSKAKTEKPEEETPARSLVLGAAQLQRILVFELERIRSSCLVITHLRPFTRREALAQVGGGFGLVAFANMISSSLQGRRPPTWHGTPGGVLKQLHFKPRAKRVIFLFSNGGMSHVDTFDPKPMLDKYDGQPMPGGAILTQRKTGNLMKSPFKFHALRQGRHRSERTLAQSSALFPRTSA